MRYNRLYKDNNFLTPTNYTQQLSAYTVNLKYEDLPPKVVERAKMILLQTIGVALASKNTAIAQKALKMALEANGGNGGPTAVWGSGKKMGTINAALALGTMSDALDWEDWLTKDLGKRYLIMDTLMKHWPANMWVQTTAEIVHNLAQANGFGPEDVEEIIVDPPVRERMWAPDDGFTSVTHAQFSVPFVVASMLYDPNPGAQWYTEEKMKDPKIIALAKRVKGGPSDPDSPLSGFKDFRAGTYPLKTVTITLKDGRKLVDKMDCHPGHPANMMTREQFVDRFRIQAAPVLQGEKLEKAIETLCSIENVADIADLASLLAD